MAAAVGRETCVRRRRSSSSATSTPASYRSVAPTPPSSGLHQPPRTSSTDPFAIRGIPPTAPAGHRAAQVPQSRRESCRSPTHPMEADRSASPPRRTASSASSRPERGHRRDRPLARGGPDSASDMSFRAPFATAPPSSMPPTAQLRAAPTTLPRPTVRSWRPSVDHPVVSASAGRRHSVQISTRPTTCSRHSTRRCRRSRIWGTRSSPIRWIPSIGMPSPPRSAPSRRPGCIATFAFARRRPGRAVRRNPRANGTAVVSARTIDRCR